MCNWFRQSCSDVHGTMGFQIFPGSEIKLLWKHSGREVQPPTKTVPITQYTLVPLDRFVFPSPRQWSSSKTDRLVLAWRPPSFLSNSISIDLPSAPILNLSDRILLVDMIIVRLRFRKQTTVVHVLHNVHTSMTTDDTFSYYTYGKDVLNCTSYHCRKVCFSLQIIHLFVFVFCFFF